MDDQATGEVLLRANALRKDYGGGAGVVHAVRGVDLEVARGEAVAVRGPSGCGKSTLLHLLGALDRPTAGELWLGGRRIDRLPERALAHLRRSEVGFVFQAFHLMDELTAQENVELPALLAARRPQTARQRARQLLERVGLADRANHLPAALSGGEHQRVAIARALANEPGLLLADEPTGNLDSTATLEVLRLFQDLHEEGLTLVVVTHDERIAASADRQVAMRDGAFVGRGGARRPLWPRRPPGQAGRSMMGKVLLIWRLAVKDIRHRPVLAALLLVALAASAAILTLGLALEGTADNPYAVTRAATNGPDVVATDFNGDPQTPAEASDLVALERAPGVTASSGPFPVTWTSLLIGRTRATAAVEGRSTATSTVDRPRLTRGTWVRPGGVVVEAGFAAALGLHVGERVHLGGAPFRVVGIAVSVAFPSYPDSLGSFLVGRLGSYSVGLVWVPETDVAQLAAVGSEPVFYYLDLKLADPAAARGFAARYTTGSSSQQSSSPSAGGGAGASTTTTTLYPWQFIRSEDVHLLALAQLVLYTGSWLLALLALASVAVLVGGRMAEQTRRVGLLKAVGGTPRFVAAVLLCEQALLGLCAAAVGLLVGWLAAPLIAGPGAGLLGAPNPPSLTAVSDGLVVALALGVAIAATFVPAVRAARQSTVAALDDAARAPRRRSRLVAVSAHLPVTLLLGVRLAVRRPWRLALSVCSVAVMASGLVAVLIVRTTAAGVSPGPRVTQAITIITVALVVLATINAVFIAWSSALDVRRPAALARALGATPQQVATGLATALALPALLGALLGIPGGILIYDAPKHGGSTTIPSVLSLVAVVVITVLVVAALSAVPVSIGARRPAAAVLQSETR